MKRIVLLLLAAIPLLAFEPGQLSLDSVSNFEDGDKGFTIRHRFYGDILKSEDFFGLDNGSNTLIGFRYAPVAPIILEVHHTSVGGTYNARIGYAYKFKYLHTQLNLNYFSFEVGTLEDRRENYFYNLALQTPLIFEHLRFTTNVGYDAYYEKVGAGAGIELLSLNPLPVTLTFTESVSLIAEYYTKHEDLEGFTRKYNSYVYGINFRTFGHHFELVATNSIATTPRTMMQGTDSNVVHFGFNINRKF